MESKRQQQVGETVKRHFSEVLRQEGSYIYGTEALVSITSVKMSPDLKYAKIYISVFNSEDKYVVLREIDESLYRLKQSLSHRLRNHVRRIPDIAIYLDDTIDEMYKIDQLFKKINSEE